jgi:excisionase family DNA binding protein
MKIKEMMADYEKLLFGGDYELVRVENPANDNKGYGAGNSFVFIRELSEEVITSIKQSGHDLGHELNKCKSKRRRKGDGSIKLQPAPMSKSELILATKGLLLNEVKYSIRQAAQLLGVGQTTLRTFMKNGQVPVIRLDGKLMFLQKDLEEFIQARYGHVKETIEIRSSLPALPAHIANSPHLKGIYS